VERTALLIVLRKARRFIAVSRNSLQHPTDHWRRPFGPSAIGHLGGTLPGLDEPKVSVQAGCIDGEAEATIFVRVTVSRWNEFLLEGGPVDGLGVHSNRLGIVRRHADSNARTRLKPPLSPSCEWR